ncbi:hypothetical protein [Actinoplanes sp. NPDC026670]|uniref:hypothetical protein n=1 Tax=Actinoplanes sp. NPDC026670 TaxID=3154700 RepID=UPI0034057E55
MAQHQVIKPEKIVATAAVLLEEQLVIPAVFRREGIDAYKGADNDAINVTVEGVLPFRTYGWRNDRSAEIQFDEYKERKIQVTFGGDIYNAVKLTDEQNEFDLPGWAKLARKQTEAISAGLEAQATDYLVDAPYAVTLGVSSTQLRKGLIRARATLNKLRVPKAARTLLVGTDWEAALLEDEKLNLAQNVGEGEAVAALREATIGRRYGFNIVVAQDLPPTMAVAMVDSAFIFLNGAPAVPQSVPFGATSSHNGVALRWIRDYDSLRFQDRSIFNTWKGFQHVKDILLGKDEATNFQYVGQYEHFVRAIQLDLDGEDSLPDGVAGRPDEGFSAAQDDELANMTGLGTPKP